MHSPPGGRRTAPIDEVQASIDIRVDQATALASAIARDRTLFSIGPVVVH
jgi:hypothetical protein